MTKKLIMVLVLLLLSSLFSGCVAISSANGTKSNTTDKCLASIEVYSAANQTLVTTIQDEESLVTFNENTSLTEKLDDMDENYMELQEKLRKESEKYEAQYIFISYRTPAAIFNDDTLEKELEITTYKDTNIVKVQISPENVKNFSVPSEYLTFYLEISDEVIAYLYSLV